MKSSTATRHDSKTVETIVKAMEAKYGRANRIWVMDRGMVSEANLKFLRDRGGSYIVGTPKAMLRQFEQHLTDKDWQRGAGGSGGQAGRRPGRARGLRPGPQPGSPAEGTGDAPAVPASGWRRRCRRCSSRPPAGRLKDLALAHRRLGSSAAARTGGPPGPSR